MTFNSAVQGNSYKNGFVHDSTVDESEVKIYVSHSGTCLAPRIMKFSWRCFMRIAQIGIPLILAAVLSLSIGVPKSGQAQESPSGRPAASIDDGQLRSFAKVYVQVEKIRETYGPQLKETQDPQKGIEIQKEAKSKIDGALAKEGMTVEAYSQTIQSVNANDDLRKKAIELIDQERTKP
jgi:hypothetical protein